MRHILPLSILVAASFSGGATDSSWRMHPTFDGEVTHVVNTPDYVYFTSRQLPKSNSLTPDYVALFRYDKKGEELMPMSTDNVLASTTLFDVMRNPEKKYMLALGSDYSIELIYDNGKTVNIPAYKNATMTKAKTVNSITPDPGRNRVYLSTNFGYVELNDEKHEISESRDYGELFRSVARLGDKIIALRHNQLVAAPIDHPRFAISDYKRVADLYVPIGLYPVSDSKCVLLTNGGAPHLMYVLTLDENGEVVMGEPYVGNFFSPEYNDEGVSLCTPDVFIEVPKEGDLIFSSRPEGERSGSVAIDKSRDFWVAEARKGLRRLRLDPSQGWESIGEYILPDSPSPYISDCMAVDPALGFVVANFGETMPYARYIGQSPFLLSTYNAGRWENISPAYRAPEVATVINNPFGFVVDLDNCDYIYVSSLHDGMARLNLSDPEDVIHFVSPSHPAASQPGYVPLVEDLPSINNWSCCFSKPYLDQEGNLWTIYSNFELKSAAQLEAYCWEAADRKATTSPADIRLPKKVLIDNYSPGHYYELKPLMTKRNRNLFLVYKHNGTPEMSVINMNGTPTDTSDDRVVRFNSFIDQDGNSMDGGGTNVVYEDPATGYVWVGHGSGVFYFDPQEALAGNMRVTRIKVARNDGTNLADYLLNEVNVMDIISDSEGNKWFATNGAGLVCTSSDGRTIFNEFTTDNSPLPSNEVMKLGFNPGARSLMVSTMNGLAEHFIQAKNVAGKDTVKVYPNPVRPGYTGYITIDGLGEGDLVKITDSAGNVVKELGPVSGTSVTWDGTNQHLSRVSSGVYFILTSGADGDKAYANVGKILMVN